MKIAFIFDTCFLEYDGKFYDRDWSYDTLCKKYLKHYDSLVVVAYKKQANKEDIKNYSLSSGKKIEFRCIEKKTTLIRVLSYFRESRLIKHLIHDCDFAICRGVWGVTPCKKNGMSYILEIISCVRDILWNRNIFGKFICWPVYFYTRKKVLNSPFVIYVTKKFLQKRYPTKGRSIFYSDISFPEVDEKIINDRSKKIEKLESNSIIKIGTAAKIDSKIKGHKYVLRAIFKLKSRGINNFQYYIVGDGDDKYLKKLINKYNLSAEVKILGLLDRKAIGDWYQDLDIYIQPSKSEGLPRSVIEAMSYGLPVYASNVGGIPELIEKDCLLWSGNARCIVRKLKDLTNSKLKLMSKNNFDESSKLKTELEEMNLDIIIKEYIKESFDIC